MRIGLLAHNLRVAGGLSVGRNIVATLPAVAPEHEYFFIVPAGYGYETHSDRANVQIMELGDMSFARRAIFEKVRLGQKVRAFRPDWLWGLGNLGLQSPGCKQAILFHDPHLVYPEKHYHFESAWYKMRKRLLKRQLARCLKCTDIVFCQTQTVRKRFADTFGYPIEQIHICLS